MGPPAKVWQAQPPQQRSPSSRLSQSAAEEHGRGRERARARPAPAATHSPAQLLPQAPPTLLKEAPRLLPWKQQGGVCVWIHPPPLLLPAGKPDTIRGSFPREGAAEGFWLPGSPGPRHSPLISTSAQHSPGGPVGLPPGPPAGRGSAPSHSQDPLPSPPVLTLSLAGTQGKAVGFPTGRLLEAGTASFHLPSKPVCGAS